jgi:hypothetical protein
MRALLNLLLNLPWWIDLALLAVLAAVAYGLGWYFRYKFHRIIHEAVVDAGSALKDAAATVHSVTAVPLPAGRSPYDIDRDDENFVEGVDDEPWDEEGVSYYAIEATITPASPTANWDPTGLALVPADYVPDDPTELSEQVCPLHSAEIFVNGDLRPAPEKDVRGPQRLRMVFAVHDGLRAVKFALFVTYFGRVDLPAPLPKGRKAATKR